MLMKRFELKNRQFAVFTDETIATFESHGRFLSFFGFALFLSRKPANQKISHKRYS